MRLLNQGVDTKDAESVARFAKRLFEDAASKSASGLIYGVPQRWLVQPEKLNRMDFARLAALAAEMAPA